jgi:hypothetical protein
MPGKETARSEHRRGRRSLRHLALAAMLAALTALLTSGMVLADGWPSGPPDSSPYHGHHHSQT